MSNETAVCTEELLRDSQVDNSTEAAPAKRGTLRKVLARIRADRTRDAAAYLEECKVPHGGE